ncbi:MAG: tyrosine recombinase [Eubacteriales bacterium]
MKDYINDFMLYLEQENKVLEGTRISYKRDLVKFNRYVEAQLGGLELVALTSEQVEAYIAFMHESQAADTTISRSIVSLKAFYEYLAREDIISKNIAQGVIAPKIERIPPKILTKDEVIRLLEAPNKEKPKEIRDRAMLELLYATGMKVTELIQMQVSDVVLKQNVVCTKGIGGAKMRIIPIGNTAKKAITYYMKNARPLLMKSGESDILFLNCSGRVMSRQGFWKLIKAYAKKAGIKSEITPHILRNSCASHMIENGADLRSVQEMLGHSTLTSTQIYLNPDEEHLLTTYQKTHPRM